MASPVPEEMAESMVSLQRRIVDEKKRVMVVFEGRSGRIMGRVINTFMNLMDPRGLTYSHFIPEAMSSPDVLMRYMSHEPADGQIAIYDRSWYSLMVSRGERSDRSEAITRGFERYLASTGTIVIKIFLNVDDDHIESVAKSIGAGRKADGTFLTDDHIDPKKWRDKVVMPMIAATNTPSAPWDIIEVGDLEHTCAMVCNTFLERVTHRLDHPMKPETRSVDARYPNPRESADLTLKAKGYSSELEKLSAEVSSLQSRLAESGRSMVIVFEGWDAAGKGGSIKRLTRALNPRGYTVHPVAAPVGDEKVHSYLWRFACMMPEAGHISIFDRSWYGRMMVEPIEGFCTPEEYGRSASEIRGFEGMLIESGAIVIKFWMEVSPEEQLERFRSRQEDPSKNWKITDEDWRNREKWDTYSDYIDAMIESTNMPGAPWIVVESEDKKYGRLKVLRTVRDILRKELD